MGKNSRLRAIKRGLRHAIQTEQISAQEANDAYREAKGRTSKSKLAESLAWRRFFGLEREIADPTAPRRTFRRSDGTRYVKVGSNSSRDVILHDDDVFRGV